MHSCTGNLELFIKVTTIPRMQSHAGIRSRIHYETWLLYTIDMERFAEQNIQGFSAIKIFMDIVLHCLGHKCLLFSTINERHLYSQKNFCGTLKTVKS